MHQETGGEVYGEMVEEREAELCCSLASLEEVVSWESQTQEMRA